jgi:predicted NBD/HSP70 family sugar kinase
MYAAVDIGGTKTLVAVFDASGAILERIKFPTPPDYDDFKRDLAANVAQLTTKDFIAGAIGIRGNIDRAAGLSLQDDVLAWQSVPIRDDCQAVFGCNFVLENDSKLAGLSEAIRVKETYRKVLYVTVSTGIGSAFIVDGVLDPDTQDSEIGKSVYEHEGQVRQLEDFASGKAIVEKYGKRASDLDDPTAWQEISQNLAIGLINATAAYTPDVIILGGGVGSHFHKFEQPLKQAMLSIKPAEITMPAVQQAQYPEEAVIYGCFELARTAAAPKE